MNPRWASGKVNQEALTSLTETRLLQLGWLPVQRVDGSKMDTWEGLSKRMADSGLAECIQNGWPAIPFIIEKQQLFQLHGGFVEKTAASKSAEELLQQIKQQGDHHVYKEITSMDQAFTSQSTAWSFSLDGLLKFKMPEGLQLTKLDAIASFGIWYTGGHIETGATIASHMSRLEKN